MIEIIAILFGIAGVVFGLWRYSLEQKWYSRWHSAERKRRKE